MIKAYVCAGIGVSGGVLLSLFGEWDAAMLSLLLFMGIDYLSGLTVAGIFHTSPKTENGALESKAGFKGLFRKGMILLIVLIGYRLDLMLGTNYIRDAVCIAFMCNELLSIIENAGLMGIPIPGAIQNAIEMLTKKGK